MDSEAYGSTSMRQITTNGDVVYRGSGRSGVVLGDVVFPSKQAGKVDGFLDRHQIAVVSALEPNSAGAKFPVVMSFVTPLVEYLHGLITTNSRERKQKDLSSISLMRRCLYRCPNGFPIWNVPRHGSC